MRNKVYNYLPLFQKYVNKFLISFTSEVCHYVVYHMNHRNPRHWEECVKTQRGGKKSNQKVTYFKGTIYCDILGVVACFRKKSKLLLFRVNVYTPDH